VRRTQGFARRSALVALVRSQRPRRKVSSKKAYSFLLTFSDGVFENPVAKNDQKIQEKIALILASKKKIT
jgi:hypothetical protein